jgi:hypothetical protein
VYYKSLVVFALSTVFVASFVVVLNYETSGIGRPAPAVVTSRAACSATSASCESVIITSADLRTVNYTDELGVVNFATIRLGLKASGPSSIDDVDFFVGNMSAGYAQGPFVPGVNKVVSITVPATISVSPGRTYSLSVEGFYGVGSSVWTSERITAT